MSAIWGLLSQNKDTIQPELTLSMKQRMSKFKIDRIDDLIEDKLYFACGHQYLTPESLHEILPYHDTKHNIYFTADCIIDNRSELLDKLQVTDSNISDGMLSYQAYLTWGERFVDHLLGAFSFAIFDKEKDTFLLYADHVGNRTINYSLQEHTLYFCTTYDLFKESFSPQQLQLSKKWITACEAEPSACMILFPGLTPFENVFQVKAAHYIKYTNGTLSEIQYWNPKKSKTILFKQENQYKELVTRTFKKCVEDLLRPGVHVAANLSSGLDSTSVVSIAAPFLEKRGETLHTYTSIPDGQYDYKFDDYYVPDESAAVRKTVACFPNIKSHFIDCKGENALTHMKQYVEEYDIPLKSSVNLNWIYKINQDARAKGCTIQLTGQTGNATISFGDILTLTYEQIRTLHFGQAKKSAYDFIKKNHIPKKYFLHIFSTTWLDKMKEYIAISGKHDQSMVNSVLLKKYHIKENSHKMLLTYGNGSMLTNRQRRNVICSQITFQQIGIYNTMSSLINGIIERDPTKDKRMIELCIALPMRCFVSHGTERYLVRGYLSDIVPKHIISDINHRGLQSGDYLQRLERNWDNDRLIVIEALNNPLLSQYIKQEKIDEMINFCKTNKLVCDKTNDNLIIYILYTISLSYFLSANIYT
ncbi:MAG: asparagine synthase-related protein [Lachnospiraceae bacterium]|nr:asparagine synthase-related protein [Lachnospiraceae bacterium]